MRNRDNARAVTVDCAHRCRCSVCLFRDGVMSVFHDEVEIEDFEYDSENETYYYPCPCGDQFEITRVRNK